MPDANEAIINEAREIWERILRTKPELLNEKPQEVNTKINYDVYDCFEDFEDRTETDEVLINFMPAFGSDKQASLEKIAVAAVSKGALDAAAKSAVKMKPSKHQKRVLETIIQQHLRANNVQEAYQVCLLAKNPIMRLQLLSTMQHFENVAGYIEACKEAISEALELVEQRSIKKSPALKHVALLLAKIGNTDSALKTVEGIDDAEAKIIVWCRVAEALAEQGNQLLSKRMFSDAIQAAMSLQRIPIRYKALENIAEVKVKLGDVVGAVSVAESIMWNIKRAEFLNYCLESLPSESFFGKTCVLLSYKEEFKILITRHRIISHIAEIQAQKGDFEEAINTANLIEWDILRCKTLHLIGKASLKSGKKDLSKKIFTLAADIAVESKHLDIEPLLKEIIVVQAGLGDFESAHNNSMHIKAAYDRAESLARIGVSRARIKGYADAQVSFRDAVGVAKEIYDVGCRIDTLIKVALMEAEVGGIQAACNTISIAKDLADTINEWYPRFDGLLKVAFAEAKTGRCEKARQTFKDAEKIVEDDERLYLVRAIAVKQAEAGLGEDALVTSKKLIKHPYNLPSVSTVFLERGEIGNFLNTLFLFPYSKEIATRMCVLLAQAYPEKAGEIADSVAKYVEDDDIGTLLAQIEIDQLSELLK